MSNSDDTFDFPLDAAFEVSGRRIANGERPYVIAEAGSNFNQSLDTGYALIDAAAASGADAVKFQLFRPESLYPPGTKEYDAVSAVTLNPEWVPSLADHAEAQEIAFMASAFDVESVDILDAANVPAHKVGSSEATNLAVLARMAKSGQPIFLSTGMCDMVDIHEAVAICVAHGNRQVALMQCGAMYPLPPELTNLKVLDLFRRVFGGPAGLSDHTLGFAVPVAAVARGAAVIEKHFTLDRTTEGPDHFYALEPDELKQLVTMLHEAHSAIGQGVKAMLPEEREFGRREGLYAARHIAAGAVLTMADIEVKRPAIGLRARYRDLADGARAARDIAAGEPITWNDLAWPPGASD
jgi:sialic acid synthase SpsE